MTLILDFVMAGLLVTTIVYCWRLNKRVQLLRDNQGDLAKMIDRFDQATRNAQNSVQELQDSAKELGESMEAKFDKANFLGDDLAFLIEKGNKVADRLEGKVREHRKTEPEKVVPLHEDTVIEAAAPSAMSKSDLETIAKRMDKPSKNPASNKMRSKAEQALFDAIKSGRGG
jgi:seryl-tRNA synthetase